MHEETGVSSSGPREQTRTPDRPEPADRLMGEGEVGGKAKGLLEVRDLLRDHFGPDSCPELRVDIPRFVVIATDMFERFMQQNHLSDLVRSGTRDEHLAKAFQRARLPEPLVAALRQLVETEHRPLAVRSSSLLEDALHEPFAGIYATKMVPNNQFSVEARLRTLQEAVKFVYASTFSRDAKAYRKAIGRSDAEEKMAVIIQEVVGQLHGDRFYPTVSGVARSRNFYSMGHGRPEEGVVSLALGLGKTIVDGGRVWTYSPAYPRAKPPFASAKELLNETQTRFWCVNMGKPPSHDATQETEYLSEGDLMDAERDGVLGGLASTYDPQSDRVVMGTRIAGPRVLCFSPLLELKTIPLNDRVKALLETCEQALGNPVEIEFAVNLADSKEPCARLAFLQVRPMLVSRARVEVGEEELRAPQAVVASDRVLGNGSLDSIRDVVYVKPDAFSAKDTWLVGAELDEMNHRLLEQGRPYLLVVIGRLGTSEPWLGIPVRWAQVCGAKAIVEATTSEMNVDMSQGSHFFHNVTNLKILYFSADRTGTYPLRWDWLESQTVESDARFVRHVQLDRPLQIKVDGESGRGVITHEGADQVRH